MFYYIVCMDINMTEQEFFAYCGKRVRELRRLAKLTQKQVAQQAGIYQGDLSAFEKRGEKIKSANQIRLIVQATGHTMPDLFEDAGKKKLNLRLTSRASAIRPSVG